MNKLSTTDATGYKNGTTMAWLNEDTLENVVGALASVVDAVENVENALGNVEDAMIVVHSREGRRPRESR